MKIAMILVFLLLTGNVIAETTCGVCVCDNPDKQATVKDALQIALVVLVVLLVIVGLAVGFSQLNKKDDEYY